MRFFKLKREQKQSESWRAIIMTAPAKNPIWTKKDFANLAEAGFKNCMVVYQCVSMIAEAVAGIEWELFKMPRSNSGKMIEIEDHPLINILRRPNPKQGGSRFFESICGYYLVAGNSYIEAVGPDRGAPRELYSLRPDRVKVIPGNAANLVGGYRYKAGLGDPVDFLPEKILHLMTFHPLDDWYGLSPLEVAAKGIDISNMAQTWNMRLLENDMRPPGGFKVEANLSADQRKFLDEQIKSGRAGYENAGRHLLLEGGAEWQSFAITPRDADWLKSDKANTRKICGVYNVAPELVGDAESRTYSNYAEARKAFYMEAILPLMDYLRDEFNNWLTPQYGDYLRLNYNKDDIEALKEEQNSVYARMTQAWWLTLDEKRLACGYAETGTREGKRIFVPLGLMPIESNNEKRLVRYKSKDSPSFWQNAERKQVLWTHFAKRVGAKERRFDLSMKSYLKSQADDVRKRVAAFRSIMDVDADKVFNVEREAEEYFEKFKPHYASVLVTAGEAGRGVSGGKLVDIELEAKDASGFEITPEIRRMLEDLVLNSGTEISKITLKKIERMIERAMQESWTVEDLTQEIYAKLEDLSVTRSRLISRTEMAKVENWGQLEGYKQAEYVEHKGWLCAFVPDSRESHKIADSEYSNNPIPLEEPFRVDGEFIQYPGDPAGSAGNVCNCLCSTYPEVVEIGGE